MTIDKTIQRKAVSLQETLKMPAERATVKAEGTIIGKIGAGVGLLLMLGSVVLGIFILAQGDKLTLVPAVLVGFLLVMGFVLFGLSVTLISRDAAPTVAAAGELLVKLARVVRGKKGNNG